VYLTGRLRLAGRVAHDYNNILGIILGYADLLEREISHQEPAYKMLKAIIAAAERSANLTKQLLAFARRQIVVPVVVNLNNEHKTFDRMLERLIYEEIKLVIKKGKALWTIKIDPTQLTQILTNLATNARDAISGVGTITIETRNVVVDRPIITEQADVTPGKYVTLSFSDTGCGMSRETMAQIFEPFFTTKATEKGTGLGLATVFGIVKQNNGFINVFSELDRGTTFRIYFPRFFGEIETSYRQQGDFQLSGTVTILIVEDEEELLRMMRSILTNHGYKVFSASLPSDALKLCKTIKKPIDLLVTDVVMPGMNGRELKEQIEKNTTEYEHCLYPDIQRISSPHTVSLMRECTFCKNLLSLSAMKKGISMEDIVFLKPNVL